MNVLTVRNRQELRAWFELHAADEAECWVAVKHGRPVDPDVFYYLPRFRMEQRS